MMEEKPRYKDSPSAYMRRYYKNNPDKMKKYREKNRERVNEYSKRWHRTTRRDKKIAKLSEDNK